MPRRACRAAGRRCRAGVPAQRGGRAEAALPLPGTGRVAVAAPAPGRGPGEWTGRRAPCSTTTGRSSSPTGSGVGRSAAARWSSRGPTTASGSRRWRGSARTGSAPRRSSARPWSACRVGLAAVRLLRDAGQPPLVDRAARGGLARGVGRRDRPRGVPGRLEGWCEGPGDPNPGLDGGRSPPRDLARRGSAATRSTRPAPRTVCAPRTRRAPTVSGPDVGRDRARRPPGRGTPAARASRRCSPTAGDVRRARDEGGELPRAHRSGASRGDPRPPRRSRRDARGGRVMSTPLMVMPSISFANSSTAPLSLRHSPTYLKPSRLAPARRPRDI